MELLQKKCCPKFNNAEARPKCETKNSHIFLVSLQLVDSEFLNIIP
jgi:hypothetical protein